MARKKPTKEYEFERIFADLVAKIQEDKDIKKKDLCRFSGLSKKDNLMQAIEKPQKDGPPRRITLEDALHLAMGVDQSLPDLIWHAFKIFKESQ